MRFNKTTITLLALLSLVFPIHCIADPIGTIQQHNQTNSLLKQARSFQSQGDIKAAEKAYFDAIKTENKASSWVKLANFYFESGQSEKLLKVTSKIRKSFPDMVLDIAEIHNSTILSLNKESEIPLIKTNKQRNIPTTKTKKPGLKKAYNDFVNQIEDLERTILTKRKETVEKIKSFEASMQHLSNFLPEDNDPLKVSRKYEALSGLAKTYNLQAKVFKQTGELENTIEATKQARICSALAYMYIVNASIDKHNIDVHTTTLPDTACTGQPTVHVNQPQKRTQRSQIATHKTTNRNFPDDIRQRCANKWGSNYEMVNHCIKQQTQALSSVKRRPDNEIMDRCVNKWGTNYEMVEHCLKQQSQAKADLARQSSDEITGYCQNKWNTNYEMVDHCVKQQRQARAAIRSYYATHPSLKSCKRKWGINYEMVEHCIKN